MSALDDELRSLLGEVMTTVRKIVRDEIEAAKSTRSTGDEYITVAEAARIASVHQDTLRAWLKKGALPKHQAGRAVRVRRRDLDQLLKGEPKSERDMTPSELARKRHGG